jgi:hypothetical protein
MSYRETLAGRSAAIYADFLVPHLTEAARLLDCGCGAGSIAIGLATHARRVVGLDLDGTRIARPRAGRELRPLLHGCGVTAIEATRTIGRSRRRRSRPSHGVAQGRKGRAAAHLLLATAALLALAACDLGSLSEAPAGCVEAGAQCRLPEGPLGVCERSTCAAGATPPCFQCVPQH